MTSIDALVAIHHPLRRRILEYLHLQGASQVGTLAGALEQQVGSISHHLRMLARAGVVEQAPELATDGRTSWWRTTMSSMSWSVDDFDAPADRDRAQMAERVNIDHQLSKLSAYHRRRQQYPEAWRKSAFSADVLAQATPEELHDLATRVSEVVSAWREEIDLDDGLTRDPVFCFVHGFPTQV